MVAVAPNGKVKDLESKRNERGRELRGKGKKKLGEERRCMQATAVGLPSHSGPGGSLRAPAIDPPRWPFVTPALLI